MSEKHTPGLWTVDYPHVRAEGTAARNGGRPHAIARVCTNRGVFRAGEARANARRIVSCVNACAGLSDPEATITALVAALEIADELLERNGIERPEIRAALALVKEGK